MLNRRFSILIAATLLDLLFGDPPNKLHPVAWMGTYINKLQPSDTTKPRQILFMHGVFISLSGVSLMLLLGKLLEHLSSKLPMVMALEAITLKMTLSYSGLQHAASSIEQALVEGDLTESRRLLGWHLVSRDTENLTEGQIAAAAIESVAENASDGVIAPMFYYLVFGLPGALAYRYSNTVDAMLGYRQVHYEWLGKFPARLDDILNLLPARLTALLIALVGSNHSSAVTTWQRDSSLTASPNAGHPMSAMAGALEVSLEKVDHYVLAAGNREPRSTDIRRSIAIVRMSLLVLLGTIGGVLLIKQVHR